MLGSPATYEISTSYERVSGYLGNRVRLSLALSLLRNEEPRWLLSGHLIHFTPYFKYFRKHHCFNATKKELDHKQG